MSYNQEITSKNQNNLKIKIDTGDTIRKKQKFVKKKKEKLKGRIYNSKKIPAELVYNMFNIYKPFHNVSLTHFLERTIKGFNYIVVILKKKKQPIGFFGIKIEKAPKEVKKRTLLIYYGQLFLIPKYQGRALIQKWSGIFMGLVYLKYFYKKKFIWGDTITYKSYLMLVRSYKQVYPSRSFPIPENLIELRNFVGYNKYKNNFDYNRGVVIKKTKRVKDKAAPITPKLLKDPDFVYYANKNPGYWKGDGLIVLVPLTIKNIILSLKKKIKLKKMKRK